MSLFRFIALGVRIGMTSMIQVPDVRADLTVTTGAVTLLGQSEINQ